MTRAQLYNTCHHYRTRSRVHCPLALAPTRRLGWVLGVLVGVGLAILGGL